jgi:hypothetical protein
MRFSLKRLLLAIALIAVGLGSIGYAYREMLDDEASRSFANLAAALLGGALVGAGLSCPFTQMVAGSALGIWLMSILSMTIDL